MKKSLKLLTGAGIVAAIIGLSSAAANPPAQPVSQQIRTTQSAPSEAPVTPQPSSEQPAAAAPAVQSTAAPSGPAIPESAGNGYMNVDGNYVPSPSANPAGATAQCADGTYSYSQNRRGTCSHHGGVARWL